ncbi:NADH:flavin oxidoreductase [Nocardia bovistercoris]|uniref:NADH:flavin oxidoreductase n=1 Tax=Nocardia bovistercoris TaxID=2785916 RepID=UPI0018A97C35
MTSTTGPARARRILGRPFGVGDLTLTNRIVMAPMTRSLSPGGVPGDDVARYYARRAEAEVGLIITEGTFIEHPSAGMSDDIPRLWGADALAGWRHVVDSVHAVGGKIIPQLWHVGVAREPGTGPIASAASVGPSGIDLDGSAKGEALSLSDIDDLVAAYVAAAATAQRLGFDGLEVHGAHGYLIDQFLWERTNQRTDAHGGNLAARVRFAAEIVAAVRGAVSPGFPIFFRLSQWKIGQFDARIAHTPGEFEQILLPLVEAGVDVFHASTRRYWLPEFEGSDLNLAGWAKKLTGKSTVTVGSVGLDAEFVGPSGRAGQSAVTGIDELLDRAERDEFDLVAVGRALIADPEWARKTLADRSGEVQPYHARQLASLH